MISGYIIMTKNGHGGEGSDEDAGTFDRSFKYALIAYAVAEFIAIALFVYHKVTR